MRKKKSIEEEVNNFLQEWDIDQVLSFLGAITPILKLYEVDEDNDWVADEVGGDRQNISTVRIIRTVYLISKLADFHAGKLCSINMKFAKLWQRMEKLDDVHQLG